jgi:1,4-alpha-glucan branching enzyme
MKIARIRHLFFPDLPKDYFYDLSTWQVQKGHDVDVITWNKSGISYNGRVPEGFSIHSMKGINLAIPGMFEHYPFLPGLNRAIGKLKPDIIHAESHLFLPSTQAISKANKMGIPSIISVHGVFASRGFITNLFQKTFIQTLGLGVFRKADLIVCLTLSDAREISTYGISAKKIRLVPNAIDTNLFVPNSIKDDSLIVWVGRYVNEKGIEYLIRAAKIIQEKHKDIRFLLIGYGPLKAKMQKLAVDIGIPKGLVIFADRMSRQEIANVLGKAAIFVFPSLKEGMPLALLEAMAAGSAVVASNIPGVSDVIEDQYNGLLVKPKTPEDIALAIQNLLNDNSLRRRISVNARLSIEKNFSKEKMLNNLDAVYQEARSKYY